MNKRRFLTTFMAIALTCLATTALAQTSKPKTTGQTTKPTLGTVQMPGDNGKLKTTYQLGEKGNELHFTLESASFAMRYPAPEDVYLARKEQRLLVLNFTVHNPLNKEMTLGQRAFKFTVVSPDDQNFEFNGYVLETTKKTRVQQSLKPAQKVKCTIVIPIHEVGPVNKIIVQRGPAPVLRYDLTDKVGKMTSIFSKDGIDAAAKGGSVELGKPFDMSAFDVTIISAVRTMDKIKTYAPSTDYMYVVVTLSFTNKLQRPSPLGFQYFAPELRDAGGSLHSWNRDLLALLSDTTLGQEVEPDSSITGRYYFHVPKAAAVGPLKLKLIDSSSMREVTLDIAP
ncbi:MAG TPA: hypothetical protein VK171_10425 [Fimbriimonas sp.]|nr:hypothetical protein [Fimbriimonas sp.]